MNSDATTSLLARWLNRLSTEIREFLQHRATRGVAVLLLLLSFGFATYRVVALYHVPAKGLSANFALGDFHNAVYFPAVAFIQGENPYSSSYAVKYPVNRELPPYSPAILLLGLPFALLPLGVANVVWFLATLVTTLLFTWLAMRYAKLPLNFNSIAMVSACVLFSRAGHNNLISGQLAAIMALATFGALLAAKDHTWLATGCIAVASIKPTFGIPLVVIMFLAGYWRVAIAGSLASCLLAGVAVIWMALHDASSLMASLNDSHHSHMTNQWVDPTLAWMRIDTTSLIARILRWQPDGIAEMAIMLLHVVPIGLSVGYWRWKLRNHWDQDCLIALTLVSIPVAIYHMAYDSLLVIPVLLSLVSQKRVWYSSLGPSGAWLLIVLLAIPLANYLTTWPVLTKFQIGPGLLRDILASINALAHCSALAVLCGTLCRVSLIAASRKMTASP